MRSFSTLSECRGYTDGFAKAEIVILTYFLLKMENPPAPGHQDMAGFSNIKVGSQTEWSLLVEKQEGMQIVGNATFV